MFLRILLASDGSKCALKAADLATEIADKFHSELIILSVFHPIPVVSTTGDGAYEIPPEDIGDILDQAIAKTAAVPQAAGVAFKVRKGIGFPAEEIEKVAREEKCDLIVLGSSHSSGLKSLLFGSVCDKVMHAAHCPILVSR